METREITETKIYYLSLSDIRGNVDNAMPVIGSTSLQTLLDFYEKEKKPWTDKDGGNDNFGNSRIWRKTFKRDSKLEWYNDVSDMAVVVSPNVFGGIGYAWVADINGLNLEII